MRVFRGQLVQNVSGTQGLVGRRVDWVPEGPNANVEWLYVVFQLVPFT